MFLKCVYFILQWFVFTIYLYAYVFANFACVFIEIWCVFITWNVCNFCLCIDENLMCIHDCVYKCLLFEFHLYDCVYNECVWHVDICFEICVFHLIIIGGYIMLACLYIYNFWLSTDQNLVRNVLYVREFPIL